MFGSDMKDYPRKWRDMSLDYRLMFGYHFCMIALFLLGRFLKLETQITIVALLLIVMVFFSLWYRKSKGWRWLGIKVGNVIGAIFSLALGIFFLGAMALYFKPTEPHLFPWFAGCGGFIVFGILSSLKLVRMSKTQFERQCQEDDSGIDEYIPNKNNAHKFTRSAFSVFFTAVWIGSVAFFWTSTSAYISGATTPTSQKTEMITNHGEKRYVTKD
jgi:MFS family permease